MNDNFYCIDIEFPNVDFSDYHIKGVSEVSKVHHAHLYTDKDEIELKIFYDDSSYFGEKLARWGINKNAKKFGSFIKVNVTEKQSNERLQKIDLSEAKLISFSNGTNYYEGKWKYIIIKVDTVKFYWNSNEESKNTAEFYLEDKGFRIVEQFYSILTPRTFLKNDGKFEMNRMKDSAKFYKLLKASFRPEFHLSSKDNKDDRTATIVKAPKIQFKYKNNVSENEALFYGDVVLILASFYHHIKIDYTLSKIYLPESTITIKKVEEKNFLDRSGGLSSFGVNGGLNKFFEMSWQKDTINNFTILSKAITLFNQSHLVDSTSAFLIRYNIIEICDKQKSDNDKFTLVLNKKQTQLKKEEALTILLEIVDIKEHEDFKKRWLDLQNYIQTKPMNSQLATFLESQNIDPLALPISIKDLKQLRNNITHGSIDKVDTEQLRKANILLYRISGILILNLMGITNWRLNTEIN